MLTSAEKLEWMRLQDEKNRRLAVYSLQEFAKQAWHLIEPGSEYIDGWHIGAISEHLEAVLSLQIRNLVINMPPRHMKSTLVTVLFPAWVWIRFPQKRWLCMSYAANLSKRDSLKCRQIIESDWYRTTFDIGWTLSEDQNEKMRFSNTRRGERIASSVGGGGTGEGADILVADDPHKASDVHRDTIRQNVLDWWDGEMSSRGNDPKTFAKIIVMQRLHEADLSGHVLSEKGGYEHLLLPAEYEGHKTPTSIGWVDPRQEDGELLWPQRFGRAEIDGLKKDLGSADAAGQLQQRPSPDGGLIVHRDWWKFYTEVPAEFDMIIQSWDLTFDEGENNDYVVGQVWGRVGARRYLLDQVRAKMTFNGTILAIRTLSAKWIYSHGKYVEKKANGAAAISVLKEKIPGLIAVEPQGSKLIRAKAVSPQIEAGNVYLPSPEIAEWIGDYIEEWAMFPNGKHDDQVDCTSQALRQFAGEVDYESLVPVSVTRASTWRR